MLRKFVAENSCGKFLRKIAAENLGGHTKFMRLDICDRTMADVEISAPGKISAPLKFLRLENFRDYPKFKRKNLAPSYYLGSAESPTADFLQVWLKSSRSDPRR